VRIGEAIKYVSSEWKHLEHLTVTWTYRQRCSILLQRVTLAGSDFYRV